MRKIDPDKFTEIIDRIESGTSQAEIARDLGVTPGALSMFLSSDPERAERSARARLTSAEAWLDRGLEVIASALDKQSGIDATAARAYEQACARRAAVRNPAYRDKVELQHSGSISRTDELSDEELAAVVAAKAPPAP